MLHILKLSIRIILLILCFSGVVISQSIWLNGGNTNTIGLEIIKPNFAEEENITFASSVWFVSGKFALAKNVNVLTEIPFAYFDPTYDSMVDESEFTFGNPYLGVEYRSENSPVSAEFGFRIPNSPGYDEKNADAASLGMISEFIDRPEAFVPDIIPLSLFVNYHEKTPQGVVGKLRGGLVMMNYTSDQIEENTDALGHYSAQVGYETSTIAVMGGISGLWWIDSEDNAEKNWHQLGFTASLNTGKVSPGVSFRMPLDESLRDAIDMVFSLNVSVNVQ